MKCQLLSNRAIVLIAGLLTVVIFAVAYFMALSAYQVESEDQRSIFVIGDEKEPDRIDVDARIISLNPIEEEGKLRMVLQPKGNFSQGFSCTKTLKLLAPGAVKQNGLGETVFERGRMMTPVDLVYSLEGQANDYPFDCHTTLIALALNQTSPDRPVPVVLRFTGNMPGFSIGIRPATELIDLPSGVWAINLTVTRSATVIKASLAGMVVMWAIGIGVVALILLMITGWYNVRMPALFAALLFGLFSLRNSLPGTPPIGTYSDFLAFLWVQGIVALGLIVAIIATLRHRPT